MVTKNLKEGIIFQDPIDGTLFRIFKIHHVSKEGMVFQERDGTLFRAFEWYEHSSGIIRVVRKEKIKPEEYYCSQFCGVCDTCNGIAHF